MDSLKSSKISTKKVASPLNISLAYQGFVDEPVPSDLFDAVVSGHVAKAISIAKAGFLLLAGAILASTIWFLFGGKSDVQATVPSAPTIAVSSHAAFAKDAVYPVRVGVDDTAHLNNWLSYRLGKRMQVHSLDKLNYKLLGGNIVPDESRVSTSVVYENPQGIRLSVFNRVSDDASVPNMLEQGQTGKFNWLHWNKSGSDLVMVSELSPQELQSVYEALN